MSILFIGTSAADFIPIIGPITPGTTAAYQSPFVREHAQVNNARGLKASLAAPASDIWVSFYGRFSDISLREITNLLVFNDGNTPLWAIRATTASNAFASAWNGTVWSKLNPEFRATDNQLRRFDVHLNLHASAGVFEVFINSDLAYSSGNIDTTTMGTQVTNIDFMSQQGEATTTAQFSAALIADEDTRPLVMAERAVTAQGSDAQWTGAYTNISATGVNDATTVTSDLAGELSSYAIAAVPAGFTNYTVKAVALTVRGQTGDVDPTEFDAFLKIGGTNYYQDVTPPVGIVYGPTSHSLWNTNPATGLPWTLVEAGSVQLGVRSVA